MLEDRLLRVATEVEGGCHLDIGTDHAQLPLHLLNHHLCTRVIATEKSDKAYQVARQALWGRAAEVRLGDGLEPIGFGEGDSLSLCGLGGSVIVKILQAEPAKIPPLLIVQANRDTHRVRRWARSGGYHLHKEQKVKGFWSYEILTFRRAPGPDPAYARVPEDLGLWFGPHLLAGRHPLLLEELQLRRHRHHDHPDNDDLRRIKAALEFLG